MYYTPYSLPVLGRVEGGLGEHDVVLLGLTPQVLEQALLPHSLHVIPVLGGNKKQQPQTRVHSERGQGERAFCRKAPVLGLANVRSRGS